MVDLFRRRAMMGAASGPIGPLYKLKQGTSSTTSRKIVITDNNINDLHSTNGTQSRSFRISGTTSSTSAISAAWFALHAGDVLTLKIKNISYTNRYTSAASEYNVAVKDTSDTTILNIGNNLSLAKNTSGTLADKQNTITLSNDVDLSCLLFYSTRDATIEFDLELWVNDVRYL